jgi:biotin synthase
MPRYLLDESTIMEVAKWSADRGYGSIMLQSGEVETPKRLRFLCKVIRRIVEETGLGVSISVGELPDEYYQQLREAGAKRYLLRIETTNPTLFAMLHPPGQTFEARLDRLRALRRIGFMVGTGVMIGLPGQTREDLAEDLMFFQREDADMIGMGPYLLQRGTPTGEAWIKLHPDHYEAILAKESGTVTPQQLDLLDINAASLFELTTRMIALARILLQDVNIAATTALQTIHATGREVALMRGANIMMPILTPTSQRANYQLYEGKVCVDESAKQCKSCMELRVGAAGKRIAYGEQGDPPHALRRLRKQQQREDGDHSPNDDDGLVA